MASTLNKRQQARNERALQELIKTVPGNNVCADCGARNPGWASWSLGIFLCMRCATLHRKLGTHISKVKSLSMDKWDNAQVDNMKRMGNVESNKAYNPRNVKPQIPVDIDEVESAMERFIRQKYQERIFMADSRPGTRQNTGSTSSEERPPPLPPKPTRRFGFGLQKSSAASRNVTPPISPDLHVGGYNPDASPPRVNKQSRVFGSSVQGDGLESKLATLRDMGFADEKRNSQVLRGLNGNLDKAVEALIRLADHNPKSRGTTPTPPDKPNTDGLSFDNQTASTSMNPFDALDAAPQQQQQQPPPLHTQQLPYGSMSATTTPSNAYNPFLAQQQYPQSQQAFAPQNPYGQQQPQHNLDQSLQGLQLSNQQQPQQLFPNRTGGYGEPQNPQYPQTNPFQHSFTPPPMPQVPQQYAPFFQPQQTGTQSLISPTSTGASNPFLKSVKSQVFAPTQSSYNPFGQPQQQQQQQPQQSYQSQQFQQLQQQHQQAAQNPFMSQNSHQQQPQQQQQQQPPQQPQAQNPWQTQQSSYQAPQQQQQPQQPQQAQNPWQNQQQQQQPQQQQAQNPWQSQQPQQPSYPTPQPTSGFDKNSILALYNYPHLAPQQPQPQQPQQQQQQPQQQQPMQQSTPTSAATSPSGPGTLNPFAASNGGLNGGLNGGPPQQQPKPSPLNQVRNAGHVSNESVDFAGLMGGRHSPDAFSGLSASFRR